MPTLEDALSRLSQASWFSSLDLILGYWQVDMDPNTAHKSDFASWGKV